MRNKKAKAIRKVAQFLTKGQPIVEYHPRKSFTDAAGVVVLEPITMVATCTRRVYKHLKRRF